MALLQNVIQRGTHAGRPAAGSAGILYFETDTGQLFRDSGSAWQLVDLSSLLATKGDLLVGTGSGTVAKLAAGADTYVLTADSAQTDGIKWAAAAGGSSFKYVEVEDQKSQNTAGGGATSGSWQTRTLNTLVADSGSIASLASNQVTLPAGTYRVHASAPAFQVNLHQIRLRNITAGTTLVLGSSEYTDQSNTAAFRSSLQGRFTLASSSALELQHQVLTTKATNGFGVAANFGTEVYTQVEFWQE